MQFIILNDRLSNKSNEEISFTAHILLDNYEKHNNYRIINKIKEKLTVYDIFHMTVQIENTGINVH